MKLHSLLALNVTSEFLFSLQKIPGASFQCYFEDQYFHMLGNDNGLASFSSLFLIIVFLIYVFIFITVVPNFTLISFGGIFLRLFY